ncbi:hypothetical protein [Capnocytophaga cynodegmi]|uniref:hypothetical protein n=1 Tax=Capnocytophaga cynodegmi TaxID=28189 RepID=UPI00385F3FF9
MKTTNLLIVLLLSFCAIGCSKTINREGDEDIEKVVEFTIYPETVYGHHVLSTIWMENIVFSDSDNNKKQDVFHTHIDGIESVNFERGYQYIYEAKKIWIRKHVIADVSPIKYVLLKQIKKEKVITQDTEQELELKVGNELVKFSPTLPYDLQNDGAPRVYDALYCTNTKTNTILILKEIKNFNFEAGNEYILKVKKTTKATPYEVSYELLEVKSKIKK